MNKILAMREKRGEVWDKAKAFLNEHQDENGMLSPEAVSYTHLDVYKRQGYSFACKYPSRLFTASIAYFRGIIQYPKERKKGRRRYAPMAARGRKPKPTALKAVSYTHLETTAFLILLFGPRRVMYVSRAGKRAAAGEDPAGTKRERSTPRENTDFWH